MFRLWPLLLTIGGCNLLYDTSGNCSLGGELLALSLDRDSLHLRGEAASSISILRDEGELIKGHCASARAFEDTEHIELQDHPALHQDSVRISFWAKLPRNADRALRELGLITKDASGTNDGDFQLLALYHQGSELPVIIARHQSDGRESGIPASLWMCSEKLLEPGEWYDIEVEIGGLEDAQLVVDGDIATGTERLERRGGSDATCGERDDAWRFRGWQSNTNNLVLGATNSSSGSLDDFLAGGALDHVRISRN